MKVVIIVCIAIILLVTGYFQAKLGYTVRGVPVESMPIIDEAPIILTYIDAIGQSVLYITRLMSGSVDNASPLIVMLFWGFTLAVGVVVILIIRGN